MTLTTELLGALDAALVCAEECYKRAVIELATAESEKSPGNEREPANIDDIHHARTRVIALQAAREKLIMLGESDIG
jgi:hypothetical protein